MAKIQGRARMSFATTLHLSSALIVGHSVIVKSCSMLALTFKFFEDFAHRRRRLTRFMCAWINDRCYGICRVRWIFSLFVWFCMINFWCKSTKWSAHNLVWHSSALDVEFNLCRLLGQSVYLCVAIKMLYEIIISLSSIFFSFLLYYSFFKFFYTNDGDDVVFDRRDDIDGKELLLVNVVRIRKWCHIITTSSYCNCKILNAWSANINSVVKLEFFVFFLLFSFGFIFKALEWNILTLISNHFTGLYSLRVVIM